MPVLNNFLTRLVLCILALAIALPSASAEQLSGQWTLEELAREALGTYPEILASQSQQAAARADLEGARWQRFPTPSIEASQDDAGNDIALARLQQPIWTGGRIRSGIEAAEARLQASAGGIGEAEQDVLLRLVESYIAAVRRQAQRTISIENVRQHEELHGLISRRVARQISPQVDLALADSRLAAAKSQLSSVQQELQIALDRLTELTGVPVAAVADLTGWATALPESRIQAQREAIEYSPRLAKLSAQQMAASADVRAERAALLPTVAVRLEHERGETDDSRALLVLESEFGAGLSTIASTNAAAARRDALRREQQTAERELTTQIAIAWQQWRAARVRLESAQLQRESTRTVFESYTRQYVIGQKSWLDVLNATREATTAASAVEEVRAQMREPMLRIAFLTGRLGELSNIVRYSQSGGLN